MIKINLSIIDSANSLSEEEIIHAEQRLGQAIPPDYRDFLLQYNGGYPERSDFQMSIKKEGLSDRGSIEWFLGIHSDQFDNLENYVNTYRSRIPSDLFPIAHDAGGNLICIASGEKNAGQIYFWDHEFEVDEGEIPTYDNVYFVADSLQEFLEKLR